MYMFASICFFLISKDSSIYAHYVFKAFDVNCTGAISFRVNIFQSTQFYATAIARTAFE